MMSERGRKGAEARWHGTHAEEREGHAEQDEHPQRSEGQGDAMRLGGSLCFAWLGLG